MNKKLKVSFNNELVKAKSFIKAKQFDHAFMHLERAHILGQRFVVPHSLSHFYMLKVALHKRDLKEIVGQIFRLPIGVLGSLIGVVPTGNTGRSNISAFKQMDIAQELIELMEDENERES